MKNSNLYAIAIILGTLSIITTMLFHPTGADILPSSQNSSHMIQVNVFMHSLAIAGIPISFIGFLGFSRRFGLDNFSIQSALVLYGLNGIAGVCAAVFSGFGATGLAKFMMKTTDETQKQFLQIVYHYNGVMNQGFAKILVVASSTAVILWSVSLLRENRFGNVIGIFGCLIGTVSLIAFFLGFLQLDVYGFGVFVFAQAFWTISVAVWMLGAKNETQSI